MSRIILFTAGVILGLSLLWLILLPALFVVSLVPQFAERPPLSRLTLPPKVSTGPTLDVYEPRLFKRGRLVLFHAANEQGKHDPRLQNLAEIFARTGLTVFLPNLTNLNRERFHPEVLAEMAQTLRLAQQYNPNLPLAVLSFSIGVGPELIVAAEEEFRDRVDLVIAFGGYFDLEEVMAYHTTGQGQDPFGLWLFARYYAQFLPSGDAAIFYELAERKLTNPEADIADLKPGLGADGLSALRLLENRDPEQVQRLIAALPPNLREFFAVFDPEPHLKNLKAPALILHSINDNVIPFAESPKLYNALRAQNKNAKLVVLRVFDHVNPVLPPLTARNLLTLYLPEFGKLYLAAWRIIYL